MRYTVPDDVAWVYGPDIDSADESLYLMRVPDGMPVILAGMASEIWLEAASGHDVVPAIAAMTGETPDTVRADTEAFLAELVRRGLLQEKETD